VPAPCYAETGWRTGDAGSDSWIWCGAMPPSRTTRTVDNHIASLRAKLEADPELEALDRYRARCGIPAGSRCDFAES